MAGAVDDLTDVAVNANGVELPVGPDGGFSGEVALTEGPNFVTVVATDQAGNSVQEVRTVTRADIDPPVLTVLTPSPDGITATPSVAVTGTVADLTAVTVVVNDVTAVVQAGGAYSATIDMGGRHTAMVFSVMNMAGNVGAVVFPMAVPWLLILSGEENWDLVLFTFAAIYVAAAVCWLAVDPGDRIDPQTATDSRGLTDL